MGKEKLIFQSRCDDIGRCFEALDRQYAKLQQYFGGILCLNVFFKLRFFSSVSHKCYIFVVVVFLHVVFVLFHRCLLIYLFMLQCLFEDLYEK